MPTETEYVESLRAFIKDSGTQNILLRYAQENTDTELTMYVQMAMSFLNSIPPFVTSFVYTTFPVPNLLVHQATIECLISNGILHARNELSYNNGGITVKIWDSERYLKFIQVLVRMTDLEISNFTKMKVAININSGWGGVYSPYAWMHGASASLNPNSILSG